MSADGRLQLTDESVVADAREAGLDVERAEILDAAPLRGQALREAIAAGRAPKTLTDTQLAELIPLGMTQFYKRKARGEFAFLEITPQLRNSNTRYSAALACRWLDGEDVTPRTFFASVREKAVSVLGHRAQSRRPGRPRKSERQANGW